MINKRLGIYSIYKISNESLIRNLKGIILLLLFAVFAIVLYAENGRAIFGIAIITLLLLLPQIYLAIQYQKNTNYSSFEIDYKNELFVIKKSDKIINQQFSALKTIQYHKAIVPPGYLSLAFTLCEHFYYYRLEFVDGTTYYLTNLLLPNPVIEEQGAFYPYFIKIDRKYATIKR